MDTRLDLATVGDILCVPTMGMRLIVIVSLVQGMQLILDSGAEFWHEKRELRGRNVSPVGNTEIKMKEKSQAISDSLHSYQGPNRSVN